VDFSSIDGSGDSIVDLCQMLIYQSGDAAMLRLYIGPRYGIKFRRWKTFRANHELLLQIEKVGCRFGSLRHSAHYPRSAGAKARGFSSAEHRRKVRIWEVGLHKERAWRQYRL